MRKKLYFNNFITFISEKLLFWAKVIVANCIFQRWLQQSVHANMS